MLEKSESRIIKRERKEKGRFLIEIEYLLRGARGGERQGGAVPNLSNVVKRTQNNKQRDDRGQVVRPGED